MVLARLQNLVRLGAVVAASAAGTGVEPAGAGAPVPEYALKAVYLYRFTNFVSWPKRDFASPDAPFVIGILGPDPFGGALEEVVRGERVGSHPIEVRRLSDLESARDCQLLFVDPGEEDYIRGQQLRALTVGDSRQFLEEGGMIRFVTEAGRVRLQINLAAAKSAGLTLSSQLLRISKVVGGP